MIDRAVGWRIWLPYDRWLFGLWASPWNAGSNEAICRPIRGRRPCAASPGRDCNCGYWALWSWDASIALARRLSNPDHGELGACPVFGLVAAWGEVALHGAEGFRARYATILCLLGVDLWAPALDEVAAQARDHGGRDQSPGHRPLPLEESKVRRLAAAYGVPQLSLALAARSGLLGEFGVPKAQVRQINAALGRQARGGRSR